MAPFVENPIRLFEAFMCMPIPSLTSGPASWRRKVRLLLDLSRLTVGATDHTRGFTCDVAELNDDLVFQIHRATTQIQTTGYQM